MDAVRLLGPSDVDAMPWSAMDRRIRTWKRLVGEYARIHHDTYHVTTRSRRPHCSCPYGRA